MSKTTKLDECDVGTLRLAGVPIGVPVKLGAGKVVLNHEPASNPYNCPQLARIRKEYVDNGHTLHRISLMLNISETTVYRRLRAAGIPITPRRGGV